MARLTIPVGQVSVQLIDDDRICKSIISGKPFEPDSLMAWSEICKPGSSVIDVGAYSGLFSISASKLGVYRVIAIEPMSVMVRRLKYNIEINGAKNIYVIEAAASDKAGVARIGYNDEVHLTSGASILRKSRASMEVSTVSLDEIKYHDVSVIKIDVERYEMNVLKGAMKLIDKCKPKLLVEVLDDAARTKVEMFLSDYRTVAFLDNRNILMEPA